MLLLLITLIFTKRTIMKKETVLLMTCAMSFALLGCGSADGPNLNNFQNAALVNDCVDTTLKSFFNGKSVEFTSSKITGVVPNTNEVKSYTDVFLISVGSKQEELNKYREYLNSNPLMFQSVVSLNDGKHDYKCNYLYSTDSKGNLQKLPFIYSVQKDNEKPLQYKNGFYIKPYHGFEYIKQYITPNHGIKLYSLITESNLNIKNGQSGLLSAINEVITNKTYSSQKFQELGEYTQPSNAAELANYAVSTIHIPDYIPENPIYLVPVVVSKRIQNIGNYQASDIAVAQLDNYVENRYVDPDTGIATHRDTLEQMQREFGLNNQGQNVIIERVDKNQLNTTNIPDTLRVNTDKYTEKELENAAINEQR